VRFSNLVIRIRVSGEKLGIYPWFLALVSLLENSSPFLCAYLRLIWIKSPSMHKICILSEANFNSCSHVQPLPVLWDVLVAVGRRRACSSCWCCTGRGSLAADSARRWC